MKDTGFYVLLFEDIEKYGFEGLNQIQQDEVKGLVMKAMEGRVEKSESDYEQEKMRAVEKIDLYWRNQTQELQEKYHDLIVSHQKGHARIRALEIRLVEAQEKLETMTQERKKILTIVEMIRYYWYNKQFFNDKLFREAMYYLEQGENPFPKMRAELDQWLEENDYSYYLQHDVFRFSLM